MARLADMNWAAMRLSPEGLRKFLILLLLLSAASPPQ